MRALLFAFLLVPAFSTFAKDAALTHAQAVQALSAHEPALRRAAALRLEDIGVANDVPALLAALRDGDAQVRALAEEAIWNIWGRSGDRAVDVLYRQGMRQLQNGALPEATATFTRIIQKKPDFVEGWNKRATLYYMSGDYERSRADCNEVLKRNPQHFGALAGYGLILMRGNDAEGAIDYFRRALDINPNMNSVAQHLKYLQHVIDEKQRNGV